MLCGIREMACCSLVGLAMKNEPLLTRMRYAISGISFALRQEKSLRVHFAAVLIVALLLVLFQPAAYWWAILFVVIVVVIAAEMFNTAIEEICDYMQPEHHEKIGKIKDVAAGAVFVTSIGAFIVGCIFLLDLIHGS